MLVELLKINIEHFTGDIRRNFYFNMFAEIWDGSVVRAISINQFRNQLISEVLSKLSMSIVNHSDDVLLVFDVFRFLRVSLTISADYVSIWYIFFL